MQSAGARDAEAVASEAGMCRTSRIAFAGLVILALLGAALTRSQAQAAQPNRHHARTVRHKRPEIVITPQRLLYRRCVDWLELQYRPSGTVLYPQFRCWWVRG